MGNERDDATLVTGLPHPTIAIECVLPLAIEDAWRLVTDPVEMQSWFPMRLEFEGWTAGAPMRLHHLKRTLPAAKGAVLEYHHLHRAAFTSRKDELIFETFPRDHRSTLFRLTEILGLPEVAALTGVNWRNTLDILQRVAGVDVAESTKEQRDARLARLVDRYSPTAGPQVSEYPFHKIDPDA